MNGKRHIIGKEIAWLGLGSIVFFTGFSSFVSSANAATFMFNGNIDPSKVTVKFSVPQSLEDSIIVPSEYDPNTGMFSVNGPGYPYINFMVLVDGKVIKDNKGGSTFVDDVNFPSPKFAVPEPLTILGAGTALGFGTFFKRKLKPSKSIKKEATKIG